MTTQPESKTQDLAFVVQERAIIYCRVSTDEQAESGTSLDNQEEKCLAYAEINHIKVVGVFKEDYTGKVLDRPELNKVREALRNGQADNLIVYKPNRLDRSEWGINLLLLMQELKSLGVELHYSQDSRKVDLFNPMEAFMYGSFAGWQAGEDHRETVRKLYEGRLARAKAGYVVPHGKTLYGYRAIRGEERKEVDKPQDEHRRKREDKLWFFEIVEVEAKIVRLIFHWFVIGDEPGNPLGGLRIAEKLNEMGVKSPKGGKWRRQTIYHILTNETYAGVWHYGRRGKDRSKPSSESIPIPVPAIISREMWELAQAQVQENKRYAKRNRKPGRYLLAGRVTCGECGYKMRGLTKTGERTYKYYACNNRPSEKGRYCDCHNPLFRSEVVDLKVWQWVEKIARDKDRLLEGLQGYNSRQEGKVESIRRDLALVENLMKDKGQELDEELDNLNVLTSRRAKAKKAAEIEQIEAVLDELESRKAKLLAQLEAKTVTEEQITNITTFMAQVAQDLETLREAEAQGEDLPELKIAVHEAKRRLLAMLDVQVTLFVEDDKRKARVTAKVCPDGVILSVQYKHTNIFAQAGLFLRAIIAAQLQANNAGRVSAQTPICQTADRVNPGECPGRDGFAVRLNPSWPHRPRAGGIPR